MASAPCKDCEKRYSGCHSQCEGYLQFREEQNGLLKKRLMEIQSTPDPDKMIRKSIWKFSKKKGV